jgi:hypothetical protein
VKILHSFIAVGGGFLVIALLVTIATLVEKRLTPSKAIETDEATQPQRLDLLLNLGYSVLFAAAGGYVTAYIARENPLEHAMALAMVVLLLSALSALQLKGKQPVGYQLALTALTPLAVLGGGLLRLKQIGLL